MKRDRTSGATTVAGKAYHFIALWLPKSNRLSKRSFLTGLEKRCLKLLKDYPAMGNIYRLANEIGKAVEKGEIENRIASRISRTMEAWKKDEERAFHKIPRLASHSIGPKKTILTLSSSALVKETIFQLKTRGVEAIVLESRPLREGERLAYELAQKGVPTTLMVDLAFGSLEERVDLILIGADRIGTTLVNKVGTRALLEWAKSKKLPVYCVVQTSKIISATWCVLPLPKASPREVSKLKHANLQIRNFYFEEVPLYLVKTFVTEGGCFSSQGVAKQGSSVTASRWFESLMDKLSREPRPL